MLTVWFTTSCNVSFTVITFIFAQAVSQLFPPSSTPNSPLPSSRHQRLEGSCGARVWTRLTPVLIWTLEPCQAALEGSWSDWTDPFLGGSRVNAWYLSCLFLFSRKSFTHSLTFPMFAVFYHLRWN